MDVGGRWWALGDVVQQNHEDLDCRDLGRADALSKEETMSRPIAYTLYAGNIIQRPLLSSSVIESQPERESTGNSLRNDPKEDQGNEVIMANVFESREILVHHWLCQYVDVTKKG